MDSIRYSKPEGFRDHDQQATAKRRKIEDGLLDLFHNYGYGQITLPTIEYADLFAPQRIGSELFHRLLSSRISESALFPATEAGVSEADAMGAGATPASPGALPQGQLTSDVVLRPELTAPVARWFVSRLIAGDAPADLPARIAYAGQVFRNTEPAPERPKELRQVGVELIGSDRQWGDLEILCLACDGASELSLPGWKLHLGDARLYREILRTYGLVDDVLVPVAGHVETASRISLMLGAEDEVFLNFVRELLKVHRSRFPDRHRGVENPGRLTAAEWRTELVALHDAYLRHLWAGPAFDLSPEVIDELIALTRLVGAAGSFFAGLDRFVRGEKVEQLAAELRRQCDQLHRERGVEPVMTWAAGRGLAYYTGLIFELHCPMGTSPYTGVCGGGRYDGLHGWIYRRVLETQRLRDRRVTPPSGEAGAALNGVGLAFDVERLTQALSGDAAAPVPGPCALVAVLDETLTGEAFRFADRLRRRGLATHCHLPPPGSNVDEQHQIDHAGRLGARFTVLFAAEEWRRGKVVVRDMTARGQEARDASAAVAEIAAACEGRPS